MTTPIADQPWWHVVLHLGSLPVFFVAVVLLASTLHWLFGRRKRAQIAQASGGHYEAPKPTLLRTQLVAGASVDPATIAEVFELFNIFFTNEFDDEQEFSTFIRNGRDLLLFRDPTRKTVDSFPQTSSNLGRPALVGFAVFKPDYHRQVQYELPPGSLSSSNYREGRSTGSLSGNFSATSSTDSECPLPPLSTSSDDKTPKKMYKFISITNEFFGLHRDYRSLSTPLLALVKYCLRIKLVNPFTPVYYFFITYSYKSYLAFGRTLGHYFPKHSTPVPPREKQILNLLGREAAGKWGIYDDKTFVIHDKRRDASSGRLRLDLSEPREMTATIRYFLEETEADYKKGDCLCVLSLLSWGGIWSGFKKAYTRFRNRRYRTKTTTLQSPTLGGGSSPLGTPKSPEDRPISNEEMPMSPLLQERLQKAIGPNVYRLTTAQADQPYRKLPLVDASALEHASRVYTSRVIAKRGHIAELRTRTHVSNPWASLESPLAQTTSATPPTAAGPAGSPAPPLPTGPLKKLLKHVAVGGRRKAKPAAGSDEAHGHGHAPTGAETALPMMQHLSSYVYERKHKSRLLCSLNVLDEAVVECTALLARAHGVDLTAPPVTTKLRASGVAMHPRVAAGDNSHPLWRLKKKLHLDEDAVATTFYQTVVSYWLSSSFDWRAIRAELDGCVPQFITSVGGKQLHYLHLKSNATPDPTHVPHPSISPVSSFDSADNSALHHSAASAAAPGPTSTTYATAVPLLLLHSDCSSPFEFIPVFADLASPSFGIAFHAVAPSMPGCGLSSPPSTSMDNNIFPEANEPLKGSTKRNLASNRPPGLFDQKQPYDDKVSDIIYDSYPITTSALLLAHLMIHALGYRRFVVAAVGAYSTKIACFIAAEYPDNCIAVHTSHLPSALNCKSFKQSVVSNCRLKLQSWIFSAEQRKVIRRYHLAQEIQGKLEQVTDNLGSIENITAFLIQTYRNQCRSEDSLWSWPVHTLITNIVIYWATGSLPRTYQLLQVAKDRAVPEVTVPVGYTAYPDDASAIPRELGQVSQWKEFKRSVRAPCGGPFPTFETPTVLVAELQAFFRPYCHGPE